MSLLSRGTILPASCYVSHIEIILTTTKQQQRNEKKEKWEKKRVKMIIKKKIKKRMVEFYTRVALLSILLSSLGIYSQILI